MEESDETEPLVGCRADEQASGASIKHESRILGTHLIGPLSSPKKHKTKHVRLEEEDEEPVKCPIYFGVKNYLHNFYDAVHKTSTSSNLSKETDDQDFHFLILPKKRKCSSFWFKVGLVIGGHVILAGLLLLLIGFFIPKRSTLAGHQNNVAVADKVAEDFNRNLLICQVVGVTLFCCGALAITFTLLIPSFLSGCCDDSAIVEGFKISLQKARDSFTEGEPKSPAEKIPVTEHVKPIQPK